MCLLIVVLYSLKCCFNDILTQPHTEAVPDESEDFSFQDQAKSHLSGSHYGTDYNTCTFSDLDKYTFIDNMYIVPYRISLMPNYISQCGQK